MASLPEPQKLVRNFSRCHNWEEKYLYQLHGTGIPSGAA